MNPYKAWIQVFGSLCAAMALSSIPVAGFAICGDLILDPGETCDDGNMADGDCCSSACLFEPAASPCLDADLCNGSEACDGAGACVAGTPLVCDDADLCSQDSCDAIAGCINDFTPQLTCNETMGRASLKMAVSDTNPKKNKLGFRWMRGTVDGVDYGDPVTTSDYSLCVYDAAGLVTASDLPAGAMCDGDACWVAKGSGGASTGVAFSDSSTANDGVKSLKMHASQGTAWIKLKAKGEMLPLSEFGAGLTAPVTAQVVTSDADCWSTSFGAADTRKNEATKFDGRYKAP